MPYSKEGDYFKKYVNFTLLVLKIPQGWGVMEFTISCLFSLSDLCLGVEKKIFKGTMLFHYMTYIWPHPYPGGHLQFWLFPLVIITKHLLCQSHATK